MLDILAQKVHEKAIEEYGKASVGMLSRYIATSIADILDKDYDNKQQPISDASVRRFLLKYYNGHQKIKDPSNRTMNQLARYINYADYVDFVSWEKKDKPKKEDSSKKHPRTIINNYGKDYKTYGDIDTKGGDFIVNFD